MYSLKKSIVIFSIALSAAALLAGCGAASVTSSGAKLRVTTPDKLMLLQEQTTTWAPSANNVQITINANKAYQEMDGFGYTLTGGSALHIAKMSAPARAKLLQELFGTGPDDIGVSYLRVSVGASDLDKKVFSYNDLPAGETDEAMVKFDLGYDKEYLIPVLQQILKINPAIKILGSPWSPPVWMKTNGDTRGGSLKP